MCDMPRDKDAPLAGNQAHKGGEQPALRRQRQHWARAGMLALSALGPWGSISCRAFAEDNMPRLALPRLSPEEARHLSAVRLRLPSQSPTLLQLLSALHDQLEVPVFCGLPAGSDPSEVSLTMKSTSALDALEILAAATGGTVARTTLGIVVGLPPVPPPTPPTPSQTALDLLEVLRFVSGGQRDALNRGGCVALESLESRLEARLLTLVKEMRLADQPNVAGRDCRFVLALRAEPAFQFLLGDDPIVAEPCGRSLYPRRVASTGVGRLVEDPSGVFLPAPSRPNAGRGQ